MAQAVKKMGQLAQARPSGTAAATVYTVPSGRSAIIDKIILVNATGTAAVFSLYHDDNGTTSDATTVIKHEESLAAGKSIELTNIKMDSNAGPLRMKQGTSEAITITVYGSEVVLT